jgi:hypothetical protein
MVVAPAAENSARIRVPITTALTLLIAVGLLLGLGLFPSLVLGLF